MPLKAVTIFVDEERYANRLASFATHAPWSHHSPPFARH